MSRLPDPHRSQAILIGCSRYQSAELDDIPAVRKNLDDLQAVLTNAASGGFAPERCHVVHDPTDPVTVYREIRRLAARAEDTLLVYFAGHGLTGSRNELYLALTATNLDEYQVTAFSYHHVRDLLSDCPAEKRVLILDCCFSGRAIPDMSGDAARPGQIAIDGTYVLASAPPNEVSLAPAGARHTAFTGALHSILRTGLPGGPDFLTMAAIYRRLLQVTTARRLPRPRQRFTGTCDELALIGNPAARADTPQPEHQPGSPAAGPMPVFVPASQGYRHDQVYDWVSRYRSGELDFETPPMVPCFEKAKVGLDKSQVDAYVQRALAVPPDPLFLVDGFADALRDICRLSGLFVTDPAAGSASRARRLCRIPDSEPLVAVYEHRQQYYTMVRMYTEAIVLTPWGLRVFNETNSDHLGVRYSDLTDLQFITYEWNSSMIGSLECVVQTTETGMVVVCADARASLISTAASSTRHVTIRTVLERVKNLVAQTLEGHQPFPARATGPVVVATPARPPR